MRSIADDLREELAAHQAALTSSERTELALRLGRQARIDFCATHSLKEDEGRRVLERRAQVGRRLSRCHLEIIG